MTGTEWVVYCPPHKHYLKFVGVTGTTWRSDQAEAKRYPSKRAASKAAEEATWLDHKPTAWAVAESTATLD